MSKVEAKIREEHCRPIRASAPVRTVVRTLHIRALESQFKLSPNPAPTLESSLPSHPGLVPSTSSLHQFSKLINILIEVR